MKIKFHYLTMLLSLLLYSCGGEEPECVIPTSTFSITVDDETTSNGDVVGDVSDITIGSFDVRYIELDFTFTDGRTFIVGIQNVDSFLDGVCVESRIYTFEGGPADCFDLDQNTTLCNEADIEYIDSQGVRYTDFIQEGSLTITSCNSDKNTLSGSFSGMIGRNGLTVFEVSGTFSDILVTE